MSIVVTCPYCSNQAAVDPEYAGHQVQCPHCGGVMQVPMPAATPAYDAQGYYESSAPQGYAPGAPSTFICAGCGGIFVAADGVDVGGTTYCHSCAPAPVAPASVAPTRGRSAAGPPASAAAPVSSAADDAFEIMERCDGCGGAFSPAGLYAVKGRSLCAACAAKTAGRAAAAAPAISTPPPAMHEEVHDEVAHYEETATSAEQHDFAASTSAYVPRKRKADYTGLIVGGVVVVAALVGGYVYMARKPAPDLAVQPPTTTKTTNPAAPGGDTAASTPAPAADAKLDAWEKANGKELRSLERLATGQVDRKDLAGADQTYAQMFELVKSAPGGKGPREAGLRALVDGAQRKWDTIKPNVPKTAVVAADVKAEIDRLLNEADFANKGGSKTAAFERYRELFAIAKGNTLKGLDAATQKRINAAAETRRQLFDELRGRKDAFDITANQLLDTGYAALGKGKWEAAFDTLWDVRLLSDRRVKLNDRMRDEDFIRGAHGVAVAYIGLGEAGEAADMFDETQTLGIMAKEKPTKELLWNRGIFDIQSQVRANRTVNALVDFMSKDESKVDEDLLNLLGTAIATAFATPGADLAELGKAVEYYKKRNAQLEAARGGKEMHWGTKWLTAADGAAMLAKKEAAEKAYKAQATQLEAVKKKKEDVMRGERTPIKRGGATIYVTRVNEEQLKAVQAELDAKIKEVKAVRDTIPKAEWLTDIKPMIPGTGVVFGGGKPATAPATGTVRKFARYAAAFPIERFRLLTAAAPLGDRKQVRLEDMSGKSLTATVVAKDDRMALLEVSPGDAGRGLKVFNFAIGYSGGPIKCATVPVASAFGPAPEQVKAVDPKRPPAKDQQWELNLEDHPRLAGAPLLDDSGRVVGVTLGRKDQPKERTPAASLLEMQNFLAKLQALPEEESDKPAAPDEIYLVVIDLE